jgi:hypothetical protein
MKLIVLAAFDRDEETGELRGRVAWLEEGTVTMTYLDQHDVERFESAGKLAASILDICREVRENVRPLQTAYLERLGYTWESAAALDSEGRAKLEAGWFNDATNPANAKRRAS